MSDTVTTTIPPATEAPRTWTPEDADALVFGEATDQDAQPWKSDKVGKELHGLLRNVEAFTSAYSGEQTYRIVIEDKAGVRWSIIPPTQLKRLFTERWMARTIDVGKPVAIVYDSDKVLKSGRGTMKCFRILPEPGEEVSRARAANAVAAVMKSTGRQPGDDFVDDNPEESGKKPALDHMG